MDDLPLFSKAKSKTSKRPPLIKSNWQWLAPFIGLMMFVSGVYLLIPKSGQDDTITYGPVDRSLPTVVVDAGHGGHDRGAMANGLREKDLTLDTALRLERLLRQRGFPVVMTRRDDRFPTLEERTHIANKIPRALFVSVHYNDSSTGTGTGIETFYATEKIPAETKWSFSNLFTKAPEPPPADGGAAFAQAVQSSMIDRLDVVDRGAKPMKLHVVRRTRCPAILVEGGFLNNATDAKSIALPKYREKLACAIADGLAIYYFTSSSSAPRLTSSQAVN